jgi:hypothetical protein
LPAVNDDWRLRVELDDEAHGHPLAERLRSLRVDDEVRERLGGDVIVTRDGSRMFLYAGSEESVREAERVVREVLTGDGLTADVSAERWHPVEEAWLDPSVPLPQDAAQAAEEYRHREQREREEAIREGDTDWDVRVTLHDHGAVRQLATQLELEGLWLVARWHHLLVKALTAEQATALADRIRAEAPADAEIHVEVSDPEVAGAIGNPFAVFGGLAG